MDIAQVNDAAHLWEQLADWEEFLAVVEELQPADGEVVAS